jgi:hypothetical protein
MRDRAGDSPSTVLIAMKLWLSWSCKKRNRKPHADQVSRQWLESLKSKTVADSVKFFLGGFAFQGFYSEAASPNRRCSRRDRDTLHLADLRRGLASGQ